MGQSEQEEAGPILCAWCGATVATRETETGAAILAARAHVQVCARAPWGERISELEVRLRVATKTLDQIRCGAGGTQPMGRMEMARAARVALDQIADLAIDGEADYFKAAYARKLDDEKRALEAAQSAVEQNTSLTGEFAKVKLEHSALAKALENAADTLRDAAAAYHFFGKHVAAEAMEIAEKHSRETLLWAVAGRLP